MKASTRINFPERVERLSPELGASVRGVDPEALTVDHKRALRALLHEHKVLVLDDAQWSATQLLQLAQAFGTLPDALWTRTTHRDSHKVEVVQADAQMTGMANTWHTDSTWKINPPAGAVLQCEVAPAHGGGDTIWVSMSAVFASLSSRMQDYLVGLSAVHTLAQSRGFHERFLTRHEHAQYSGILLAHPPVEHPVVIKHPVTGANTLFVNPTYCHRILDVPRAESDAILDCLYQQLARPEHQLRIRWHPGLVVVWDNYATQHYAVSDYAHQVRRMNRVAFEWDTQIHPPIARHTG